MSVSFLGLLELTQLEFPRKQIPSIRLLRDQQKVEEVTGEVNEEEKRLQGGVTV